MTAKLFSKNCCSLTSDQQIWFLAKLAALLAVDARGTYEPGTEELADPSRMREFNEFQHGIAGQLVHLLGDDADRYPNNIFSQMVWEFAQSVDAGHSLAQALEGTKPTRGVKRNPAA